MNVHLWFVMNLYLIPILVLIHFQLILIRFYFISN
jgi:hypothetical protein